VAVDTGKREIIGRFPTGVLDSNSCDLTPDRLSVVCTPVDAKSDAWLVEHFDPHATPPKR